MEQRDCNQLIQDPWSCKEQPQNLWNLSKKIASLYLRCKIHFAHPFISSWLPCQVMLWICCAKTAWRTLLRRLWVCPRRNRKTETTKDGGLMIFHMTKRRSVKLGPHINTHAKRVSHWWCPMTWNIKCGSAVALKFSLLSRCSTLQQHTGPFLSPKNLGELGNIVVTIQYLYLYFC